MVLLIKGTNSSDTLRGGNDNEEIRGKKGSDRIYGGEGNDTLKGGGGNDTLFGGLGDDSVLGGSGRDKLSGGEGNDTVIGGGGKDTLFSMSDGSDDLLEGGNGRDTYVFGYQVTSSNYGALQDNATRGKIDWRGVIEDGAAVIEDMGNDTVLDYESGEQILVNGYGIEHFATNTFVTNEIGVYKTELIFRSSIGIDSEYGLSIITLFGDLLERGDLAVNGDYICPDGKSLSDFSHLNEPMDV